MKKLGILASILIVTFVSVFLLENSQTIEPGRRFGDSTKHQAFIERLDELSIPYRIDKDGFVRYSIDNQDVVDAAYQEEFGIRTSSIFVSDEQALNVMLSKLEQAKIEHRVTDYFND